MKKLTLVVLILGLVSAVGLQADWRDFLSITQSKQSNSSEDFDKSMVKYIKDGDESAVKDYYTKHKDQIQLIIMAENKDGKTINYSPFIVAAMYDQPKIMTVLYKINPNVIHDITYGGGTPFAEAAWYNAIGALKWFKEAGHKFEHYLNKPDKFENTPIKEAIEAGSKAAEKWLIKNGAKQ
ncbi:MAG: hypothetical protein ACJAZS_000079 [Alteromonas naphthalenivorans]|jgi:hypothetical protein